MGDMSYKRNLALIGFMGCGKTVVGRALSRKTGVDFVDSDVFIELTHGIKINDIFRKHGEDYFRSLEAEAVNILANEEKIIIATGGGMVKNPDSMEILTKACRVVYLKSSPETIIKNLKNATTNRPLLASANNKEELIRHMMGEREHLYEKYADITIDVSSGTVNEISDRILKAIGGKI